MTARRPRRPLKPRPRWPVLLPLAGLLSAHGWAQPADAGPAPAPAAAASAAPAAAPPASAASAPGADAAPTDAERAARRAAARETRTRQLPAEWKLEIDAPDALRTLLARYLDVARFQSAAEDDKITVSELSRLVAAAPAQARELLQTQGYFAARVDARLDAPPGAPPVVHLVVTPGPQAHVNRLTVDVQGEVAERAESGDATARALVESLRQEWALPVGAAFTDAAWSSAKTRLLTRLRADAYPSAAWVGTAARIDPQTHGVRIFVVADSGPRYRFGEVEVTGLERYELSSVLRLAPFDPGEAYSEKLLLDYQQRLAQAGLFEGVSVTIDADPEKAEAVPVQVAVRELQAHQATVGIGASTDQGPRVTFEHIARRPFGLNWQATTKLELARVNRKFQLDLISHAQPRGYRNLVSGLVSREEAAGLLVKESQLRIGRTQDTERIYRTYYAELQNSTVEASGYRLGVGALTGNYEWVWRNLDSIVMPTRGISASAKVAAGRSFGVFGSTGLRAGWLGLGSARLTAYVPFAEHWFATGRVEAGQVIAANEVAVPYPMLFRAGGDNSVRGYGYQDIGPYESGVAVGGRVLGTASIELARPFSLQRPEWLGAVFLDVGDAARNWHVFAPQVGVGVGARWRSPVGPLSLDLAYGVDVHAFRLHFNVGVAF